MKSKLIFLALIICFSCQEKQVNEALYKSDTFTVYSDKVIQGDHVAKVVTPTHIKSNYRSSFGEKFSNLIKFKVSINEKDNEFSSGTNHWVIINEQHESPIITFGKQPDPLPKNVKGFLPFDYEYTFKVDMSPVLKEFEEKGFYEAFDGTRVAKNDFKGFFVAGGAKPLSWDFVNLKDNGLQLQATDDPNIYSLTVQLNPSNEIRTEEKSWKLSEKLINRPSYKSDQPIVDALFNLSMEEAQIAIEPDSTFRTGAKWGGVWTRDVSYSILLAFAYHEPEVAKISLRRKVKRARIIQDTGSGGAWPVSSDRTTWVLAAWEIYKVTGDKEWLDEIYPIIKNSLEDDYKTIYNSETGMYSGESSFLDWREQSYPKWMSNMDIYESQNLATNVVHYQSHQILAEMAKIKGEPFQLYKQRAASIKKGINDNLWLDKVGYYGQFMYGRNDASVSPRFEALGESLAVLFDVSSTEKSASIISKSPLTEYGASCFYPQISGIPPYHNDAIWPFVQSYWNLAAAKEGNMTVLKHGLASIYRAGAFFLTNYENIVTGTGDFLGTERNSHRMLWSMAGNLAMVHRVFIGMSFETDGIHFKPVVPQAYGGDRTLSNFRYRNAVLDITVKGFGNEIKKVTLDGKIVDQAFIACDAVGTHKVVIELANNTPAAEGVNLVENHFTLPTPLAFKEGVIFKWNRVEGAVNYKVYKNGTLLKTTPDVQIVVADENYASYKVSAVDNKGFEGFTSEPIVFAKSIQIIEIENFVKASPLPYVNYTGKGFIETSLQKNKVIELAINLSKKGTYLLDINYANGSGPWNTDNKCAIRSLTVNGDYQGVLVFPQRGKDEWSDWGYSNSKSLNLRAGKNTIKIHFEDWNNNMNVDVNKAMLNHLRLISIN